MQNGILSKVFLTPDSLPQMKFDTLKLDFKSKKKRKQMDTATQISNFGAFYIVEEWSKK